MQFGSSFLPSSGWTLSDATMSESEIVIAAGGSASITVTEVENTNLLPDALLLLLTASSYTSNYSPTSFARIHILYEDGNTYESVLPIINISDGFSAVLYPSISNYDGIDVSAFVSITFTLYSSDGITLTAWSLAKSLNNALVTDTLYYGVRITTETGFEAIRSDNLARAYFNADSMAFQVGDGSGTSWVNKLYYEYNSKTGETSLVFDGELSADVITALSAIITPNLYADKGTIAELTVDELDTSVKIQNYLKSDTSDVNYLRIYGQVIQWITAQIASTYGASRTSSGTWDMASNAQTDTYYASVYVDDSTGALTYSDGVSCTAWDAYNSGRIYRANTSTTYYKLTGKSGLAYVYYDIYTVAAISTANYEQAKNRGGDLLYWTDDTYTVTTTETTSYLVYWYLYNESVKQTITFELNTETGFYEPVMKFGTGTGVTSESGKGQIKKTTSGMEMTYTTSDGDDVAGVYFRDDGFVDVTARRADIRVDTSAQTVTITPEGDGQSDIVIDYTEVGDVITFTWPDGESFTVEVT